MAQKSFFIRTFGCQMNVHDSEQLAAVMLAAGYDRVRDEKQAGVILVNTCSIRDKVAEKIVSQIGRYRRLKDRNPELVIAVGGCLAQHWGRDLLRRIPEVDLVFGTHALKDVPDLLSRREREGRSVVDTAFREEIPSLERFTYAAGGNNGRRVINAFVTIMQGCDNYCSYCVVPYLRGREKSRPSEDILEEVRILAEQGVKEITLLGQNVNSYGKGRKQEIGFAELIERLAAVNGLERIRFTTSHPKDLNGELIACFGRVDKLCEHIHLPFQSGSDRVLRLMNRGYTRDDYLARIDALRRRCPEIAISGDVMVGFPGETEEDFEETLTLMKEVRFDNLFSFKFSEREGTRAASMKEQVPEREKARRLRLLQELQDLHTLERNKALVGQRMEILTEGKSKKNLQEMTGRTRTNKIVNFAAPRDVCGETVQLKITGAYLHSLRGELS